MLSETRSNADLTSSFLLKCEIPITATLSSSAMSLSGVSTPRTSVADRPSTLPIPRYALIGSIMTSTTLPMRPIAFRSRGKSVTRLKCLSSPAIPLCRRAFVAWQFDPGGHGGGDEGGDLPFAVIWQPGDQPKLAPGEAAGPQPFNAAHF